MNTIGKILVILNFVFAVAVGGFLLMDFATRSNWKTAHDNLKRELEVAQKNREVVSEITGNVAADIKKARQEIDDLKQKLADQEALASLNETKFKDQIAEAQRAAKDADLSLKKAEGDVSKLTVAVKDLNKLVADREQHILVVQKDVAKYRNEALVQEELKKALEARNEQLLAQVQELNTRLAKMQNERSAPTSLVKAGGEANPPSNLVRGKIEQVDATGLVKLSVGSDQGLSKSNTLEVYRTSPTPAYVGTVLIVDTYPNYSVGRMRPVPGKRAQEGDQVASWLSK